MREAAIEFRIGFEIELSPVWDEVFRLLPLWARDEESPDFIVSRNLDGAIRIDSNAGSPPAETAAAEEPRKVHALLSPDSSAERIVSALLALVQGLSVRDESLGSTSVVTERESQVLFMLARGLATKEIAPRLGISERTVKFHLASLYRKLGAANRADAVRRGMERGLLSL